MYFNIFSVNIVFVILIASVSMAVISSVVIRIRHAVKIDEKSHLFAAEHHKSTVKHDDLNQKKARHRYV